MTGRRLVPRLLANNVAVRATSRKPTADQILFDWADPGTYDAALGTADAVFLIMPALVEDPSEMVGAFLDRAKHNRVQRIVLHSSMGLEFSHENGSSGRYKVEALIKGSGLEWVSLRSGGFSQNFSESFLLPGIVHADRIATAAGDGATAFVDVEDVAAVAEAALLRVGVGGQTFTLTGPTALTFAKAAERIGEAVGRPICYQALSSDHFRDILLGAGIPSDFASVLVKDQEAIRAGEASRVSDDIPNILDRTATSFESYVAGAKSAWLK